MTDCKKIFLDTAPMIYYLQKNELYFDKIKAFWKACENIDFTTSVITIVEYMVFPYQNQDMKLLKDFYSFMDDMDVDICSIDEVVADKAARIRAEYKHFKAMDALQLASAYLTGCDTFLTNDKQLKQFKEIRVILVEELE